MKKYLLPLILILLLTLTLIGDCWVVGYDQRIKLTTDHTKVDTTLSNFPVTAFFTAAQAEEIFAEFDADEDFDRGQFALGDDTLLKAEKELFDHSESSGIYHFKVPSVAPGAGTDIYFYYDNDADHNTSYIGIIGSATAAEVWDSNFKAVYHMADDTTSTILDSTSNNNDATKKGAGEPATTTGKVGTAQLFDGIDDYIQSDNNIGISGSTNRTLEAIIKTDNTAENITFLDWGGATSYTRFAFRGESGTSSDRVGLRIVDGLRIWSDVNYDNDNYHHITIILDGTPTSDLALYLDGAVQTIEGTEEQIINTTDAQLAMGAKATLDGLYFDDIMDEIRISNTNRSVAWIKATHNTLYDTLLTYGSEEEAVTVNVINFGCNF